MAASYIGTLYAIGKNISKNLSREKSIWFNFFGLNPLVVIESLVSAHIDVVDDVFQCCCICLSHNREVIQNPTSQLVISIGIKFLHRYFTAVFIALHFLERKKKTIHWERVFFYYYNS